MALQMLLNTCRFPPAPDARCKYRPCNSHYSINIYINDPDLKVRRVCEQDGCQTTAKLSHMNIHQQICMYMYWWMTSWVVGMLCKIYGKKNEWYSPLSDLVCLIVRRASCVYAVSPAVVSSITWTAGGSLKRSAYRNPIRYEIWFDFVFN